MKMTQVNLIYNKQIKITTQEGDFNTKYTAKVEIVLTELWME